MNSAIYCRVSTDDQEKEGTSLQTQLAACQTYCQDKGYTVTKTFSETYSGTTLRRPQLAELRDLVAAGDLDVTVIYCLDRISRDPTDAALLFHEFETLAVHIEAVTETIESTDMGKLINYIRGFASKLEVEKIRERTTRGKAAHLKRGHLPTGTGIGAYGYQWDKTTKKRVIIENEATVVKRIFSMLVDGNSLSQVAKSLNEADITTKAGLVWCHTTVRRTATNPIYAGETYYGRRKRVGKNKVQAQERDKWISLPDVTPAIISKETFEAAQQAIKRKYRPVKDNHSSYFLTGRISCPECGSPVNGATLGGGKYRYYRCRGTQPTRTRASICTTPYIKADDIEAYVWDRLVQLTQSPSTILFTLLDKHYDSSSHNPADLIPTIDRQIKALSTKLKTYGPKEQNLIHLYAEEEISKEHLLSEVRRMRDRETQDKHHIDHLLQARKQASTASKVTLKLSEYSEKLQASLPDCLTPEAKREFLDIYQVQVSAARGKYKFCCFADMTLISEDYDKQFETAFAAELKEFEKAHPEITLLDFMDFDKPLPDDHLMARLINDIKKRHKDAKTAAKTSSSTNRSSVTIEQTSA